MTELNTISLAEMFDTLAAIYPESVYKVESINPSDDNPEWAWMGEAKLIPFGDKGQALYFDEVDGYNIVDIDNFGSSTVRLISIFNYFADGEWSNGTPIEFDESFDTQEAAFDDAISRFTSLSSNEQSRVKWIGVRKSDGETAESARMINLDTLEWAD